MRQLTKGERKDQLQPSYLWKAAHTALVDEIRRHARRRETSLEAVPSKAFPAGRQADAEQRLFGAEMGKALLACLSKLVFNETIGRGASSSRSYGAGGGPPFGVVAQEV